jgi:hypothetical protein
VYMWGIVKCDVIAEAQMPLSLPQGQALGGVVQEFCEE